MKYLIWVIIICFSMLNAAENHIEFSFEDFLQSEKQVIQFVSSDGIHTKKYDCVELSNLININKKYNIEIISGNKTIQIENFDFNNKINFLPVYLIEENNKQRVYKKQIKDYGSASFDFSEVDNQLEAAINKTINFPYDFDLIKEKTLILINNNLELVHYSNVEKILFYEI